MSQSDGKNGNNGNCRGEIVDGRKKKGENIKQKRRICYLGYTYSIKKKEIL